MPILEGEGVSRHFGGLAAVSGVNFTLDRGETLGLIGPNGAGKTTLFNLISAALVPKKGTIKFKDTVITGLKPHQICRLGLARTFQSVKVFPNLSALDNVVLGAHFGMLKKTSTSALERANEALEFVGLMDRSAAQAGSLTLLNQKLLEIAGALATQPEVLLLDEVMAGLNPTEVTKVMDLIAKMKEKGITIFMIEHVMKAIMSVCNRIIVLHHGEKIAEGAPSEVVSSKQVIKVYLGEDTDAGS